MKISRREFCEVAYEDHLTIVTLARSELMNSLHYQADLELESVWDEFENDPDQWVAIVTGAGDRAFCAGNDLKAHALIGGRREFPRSGFAGMTFRLHMEKPVIAAVNGLAIGGGFELALACDIVVAAEDAFFAFNEPRVGIAAVAGGCQYLSHAIGLQRAMGILLTARRVSAAEGLDLGFVNDVVPKSEVMVRARKWAEQILECSPIAIRATKQVARKAVFFPGFDALFESESSAVTRMRESNDYKEGPKAFFEKRKPEWTNT